MFTKTNGRGRTVCPSACKTSGAVFAEQLEGACYFFSSSGAGAAPEASSFLPSSPVCAAGVAAGFAGFAFFGFGGFFL